MRGQQQLTAVLTGLEQALDTRSILDEAGAFLFNRIRTRFLQQIDPDGIPWEESQAAQLRRASGNGGGTLYDSGTLFRSLQLHTVGEDSRAISTDVEYAPIHNLGTPRMKKRTFLGFGEEDASLVTKLIIKRIKEALK